MVSVFGFGKLLNGLYNDLVRIRRHCNHNLKVLLYGKGFGSWFKLDLVCGRQFEEVLEIFKIIPFVRFLVLKFGMVLGGDCVIILEEVNSGRIFSFHVLAEFCCKISKVLSDWTDDAVAHPKNINFSLLYKETKIKIYSVSWTIEGVFFSISSFIKTHKLFYCLKQNKISK